MQPTSTTAPIRTFIRHKAIVAITTALGQQQSSPALDPALLQEILETVLQPGTNPAVYQSYPSRSAATAVEDRTAATIAATYLGILQRRHDSQVQRLNRLLV